MNKIFNKFLIGVLFLLGVILVPTFKVEAGVVTVTANGSSSPITVSKGNNIHIVWKALWATTCSNNFNSSTLVDDNADITATESKTFTVNCTGPSYYVYGGPYVNDRQGDSEFLVNVCTGTDSTPYLGGTDSFDIRWNQYLNGYTTTEATYLSIPQGSTCGEVGMGLYPLGTDLSFWNICMIPPSNLPSSITLDPSLICN